MTVIWAEKSFSERAAPK